MPPATLDPSLATDPDRRLDAAQVRAFLAISRDRLSLLEKTGVLAPVDRTGAGPRDRLGDVRAVARGEGARPGPGTAPAGGERAMPFSATAVAGGRDR